MRFENSFKKLPSLFYENVQPTPLLDPQLFSVTQNLKDEISIDLTHQILLDWLNGTIQLPGEQRISTRYAGHQFGVWAGQLGDGRAISLGEIVLPTKKRYEIQTKGSGVTPFSRFGDGKAVLRSSVREFIASEHMNALGVPTTRALALILGSDPVERETIERSALIARVFPTNLRFGHFEYAFHFNETDGLTKLIEYTRNTFFSNSNSTIEMLNDISHQTAKLVAQWMSFGFCHGVMNTDNMSILGLTIDYGPFGFMEDYIPSWVCNHSDQQGRYSYSNQPHVALWNLDRLLWCFSDTIAREDLKIIFDSFMPTYHSYWLDIFRKKLGLHLKFENDILIIQNFLDILEVHQFDFTYYFRELSTLFTENKNQQFQYNPEYLKDNNSKWNTIWNDLCWKDWLENYFKRIQNEEISPTEIKMRIKTTNPKYVLRNYIAQEIIQLVENNNKEQFEKWIYVLTHPFLEHEDFAKYAKPPPDQLKNIILSCSS